MSGRWQRLASVATVMLTLAATAAGEDPRGPHVIPIPDEIILLQTGLRVPEGLHDGHNDTLLQDDNNDTLPREADKMRIGVIKKHEVDTRTVKVFLAVCCFLFVGLVLFVAWRRRFASQRENTEMMMRTLSDACGGVQGQTRAQEFATLGAEDTPIGDDQPEGRGETTMRKTKSWTGEIKSKADLIEYTKSQMNEMEELFSSVITRDDTIEKSVLAHDDVSLTFKDVSFSITKTKDKKETILEPCSGHFNSGQLVALMGPSGCGKSTLLDMLAMKKTASYEGDIRVNGRERNHLYQRIAAYVGQEDVMPEFWTVREAVNFNLLLKAVRPPSAGTPPPEIYDLMEKRLDLVLMAFGLLKHQDTYIGGASVRGISGGQRRRVTLARGVVSQSNLLFCDEPTSGLSATDAELCIRSLRIIAKKFNVLVMIVIHQPRVEVADLFDKLLLLTSNPGRVVYNGPMNAATDYWKAAGHVVPQYANPSDVYLDLVTPGGPKDHADEFVEFFRKTQKANIDAAVEKAFNNSGATAQQIITSFREKIERFLSALQLPALSKQDSSAINAPFPLQLAVLFQRKCVLTLRNPSAILTPILVPCFAGLLTGVMFQGVGQKDFASQIPFVFLMLVRICMSGMQSMPSLIEERNIMKYDISERLYSVATFIIVGILVDITISLFGNVLSTALMYLISGLDWQYFWLIMKWSVLNFFVFDAIFGFVAANSKNLQMAQVSAIPLNAIFMMFSGFMVTKASSPPYLRWIFEVSPIGYAIENIILDMSEDASYIDKVMISRYGFEEGNGPKGVSVCVMLMILFRSLQLWALAYKNNIQK